MRRARQLSGCLGGLVGVLVALGGISLLAFLFFFVPTLTYVGAAGSTSGTVTRLAEQQGNYYPVISYNVAGQDRVVTDTIGTNPSPYQMGQRVPLLYDKANYLDARINNFASVWLIPALFGGLALIFLLLAFLLNFLSNGLSHTVVPMDA